MGYELTALYSFPHRSEEMEWDGEDEDEEDEDEETFLNEQIEENDLLLEQQREEIRHCQEKIRQMREEREQKIEETMQILLKQTDEMFSTFVQCVDLVLDEERARSLYEKVSESFQSDICYMRPGESTLQFLKRLALEIDEQKWRGVIGADNQQGPAGPLDKDPVIRRIVMFLTEQEKIHLIENADKETEDD